MLNLAIEVFQRVYEGKSLLAKGVATAAIVGTFTNDSTQSLRLALLAAVGAP